VEKIETAVEPRFQEHFVDAMAIPTRPHRRRISPGSWICHVVAPALVSNGRRAESPADGQCGHDSRSEGSAAVSGRAVPESRQAHSVIQATHRQVAESTEPVKERRNDRPNGGGRSRVGGARQSGGRAARHAHRAAAAHARGAPFLTRSLKPYEVLDEEGLSLIEHNADTILEEVGIIFRGDPRRSPRSRQRARMSSASS